MSNVTALPIWKQNATAAERFDELAQLAREHPERFERFAVVYIENLPTGSFKYRTIHNSDRLAEVIGLFEIGKRDVIEEAAK